jgi:hypothetical protein
MAATKKSKPAMSIVAGKKTTPEAKKIDPRKGAAPFKVTPEPEVEEMPVAVMSVDQIADPDLREAIRDHASNVYDLKAQKREMERLLDGVKADPKKGIAHVPGLVEELVELLKAAKVKTALLDLGDGRVVETTLYRGTNVQLDREMLLKAGVSAEVIAQCYRRKQYFTVQSKLKGESDE